MSKEPRRNKSKEEIAAELKASYEVARKKDLIRKQTFPAMLAVCSNIADAKVLLEHTHSMIFKLGMARLYATKMSELNLVGSMNDSEIANKYKAFYASLDSLDVGQTLTLVDQLKQGINNYVENKVDSAPVNEVNIDEILSK